MAGWVEGFVRFLAFFSILLLPEQHKILLTHPTFFSIFYYLESPAKSQNSQITASGDRRTANDFK
jgi:hypothetical protein